MIPNDAERQRYRAHISMGFAENPINTVIGKRFDKHQQIHPSKRGTDLVPQIRAHGETW
ncbi:MAG: hypothetical protein OXD33_04100 [Rhodobacteraceae bacterium]|nr:hypothetical protein [Paracoccaceae bacterium]